MPLFKENGSVEIEEREFALVPCPLQGSQKFWRLREEYMPPTTATERSGFVFHANQTILLAEYFKDCVLFSSLIRQSQLNHIDLYGASPAVFAPVYAADGPSWSQRCQSQWDHLPICLTSLALRFDIGTIHKDNGSSVNGLAQMSSGIASHGIHSLLIQLKNLKQLRIEYNILGGFENGLFPHLKNVVPSQKFQSLCSFTLAGFSDAGFIPAFLDRNKSTLGKVVLRNIHFHAPLSTLMQNLEQLKLPSIHIEGTLLTEDDVGRPLLINLDDDKTKGIRVALKEAGGRWKDVLCG